MSQSIGKANLQLGVDSKNAKAGLATFGGQVRQWADKQQQALGGMFNAALRGGAIGGFLGGSLQGIFQETLKGFTDWVSGIDALNARLKATETHLAEIRAEMDASGKAAAEWRGVMLRPADKVASLDAEIARIGEAREKAIADYGEAHKAFTRLMAMPDEMVGLGLIGRLDDTRDGLVKHADMFAAAIRSHEEKMIALGKERALLLDPTKDPKLTGDITSATRAIEQQILTWGLSGDAATLAILKAGGATEDMLKNFRAASEEFKRLGEQSTPPWLTATLAFTDRAVGHAMQEAPAWLGVALNAAATIDKQADKLILKRDAFKIPEGNAALERGSSAEVSARIRHEFGVASKDQLAEQRKANALTQQVIDAVKELPGLIVPALVGI